LGEESNKSYFYTKIGLKSFKKLCKKRVFSFVIFGNIGPKSGLSVDFWIGIVYNVYQKSGKVHLKGLQKQLSHKIEAVV
jgi:hypothetical protein